MGVWCIMGVLGRGRVRGSVGVGGGEVRGLLRDGEGVMSGRVSVLVFVRVIPSNEIRVLVV